MIAAWIAFVVVGLIAVIYAITGCIRLVISLRLINSLTVDTYNVYISNQNKCALQQCTDKALKRDKIALKRAIKAKKRSGEEIRLVRYTFRTPVPAFMSVPSFYHHINPRCSIKNWSYTVGHNIKLHCEYYHIDGNNI